MPSQRQDKNEPVHAIIFRCSLWCIPLCHCEGVERTKQSPELQVGRLLRSNNSANNDVRGWWSLAMTQRQWIRSVVGAFSGENHSIRSRAALYGEVLCRRLKQTLSCYEKRERCLISPLHDVSSMMATGRHQPAEALFIFTGKQQIVNP